MILCTQRVQSLMILDAGLVTNWCGREGPGQRALSTPANPMPDVQRQGRIGHEYTQPHVQINFSLLWMTEADQSPTLRSRVPSGYGRQKILRSRKPRITNICLCNGGAEHMPAYSPWPHIQSCPPQRAQGMGRGNTQGLCNLPVFFDANGTIIIILATMISI